MGWKHHRWEEFMEVTIGATMVVETTITMRILGVSTFFTSCWCVFDFVVALLTAISIGYGLKHLGSEGEIVEADVPLLLIRFILQPSRVLAAVLGTYRTRWIQTEVDELQVDFANLGALDNSTSAFEVMRD